MTIMRPEMDVITEQIRAVPPGDRQAQMRSKKELYGLFAKYQCSPFRSFVGPLANIGVFVPMFFGLQKMGDYHVPGARPPSRPPSRL
ncbi:hypothetical protein Naga_103245g1 [Nannochloropsis gaditana]|uniref:Uncharacterized protein n=1 Tax=Nannochloropsis gaditana TaxID=72520 RepID=W7T362_9STRA|nr:hypothetical protein Naga_103245g1 [Nannochloropsis gaditana]